MSRQKPVNIQEGAKSILENLSSKYGVSQQGLLTALIRMANGEADHGIIDIDWKSLKRAYPSVSKIKRKSWAAVMSSVRALMEETQDPEEMAKRSRFTVAQCQRAIKEINNEANNVRSSK